LNLHGLVDRLIDICPYDEPPTPNTKDNNPLPPAEKDTEDEESVGENRPINEEPGEERIEEEDHPRRNPQLSMNSMMTP